jgi:integrase
MSVSQVIYPNTRLKSRIGPCGCPDVFTEPRSGNVTVGRDRSCAARTIFPVRSTFPTDRLLASTLLDAAYGIHEVAERLGHDPGTLMRYYTRVKRRPPRQATGYITGMLVSPAADRQRPQRAP